MPILAPIVKVRPRVVPTELQFWWSPPIDTLVAVGYNGNQTVCIAKSTDGSTWTDASNNPFSGGTGQGAGIAWNGSYWVAVGFNTGFTVAIAKSTDGLTWTDASNNPFSGGGTGIAWNSSGSYWVAVGSSTGFTVAIAKSTDGMTWTDASNNPFSGGYGLGIAWNGSYWVAVGTSTSGTVCIATSSDGMTWTAASNNPFSGGQGRGIAWNGSYWVAVGYNGGETVCIAKSTDGSTWLATTNNPFSGGICNGIAWNGSFWVAVGGNGASTVTIAKSTDGMTWTAATNNPFPAGGGQGIAWNGLTWVSVSNDNTVGIATSSDGMTWTAATNNPFSGAIGFGIAYGTPSITGYVLECVSPSISVTTTEFTKTITGLTTLTDYSFTIKTDISGSYSSPVPFRTVRTSSKPQAVDTLTKSQSIVNGELDVSFSWTNPGDYATYYVYGLRAATGTQDSIYTGTSDYSTLSHTFVGLDPVRTYTFNIQRGNDAGYSAKSSITTTTTLFDPTTVTGLHFWVDATDVSGNAAIVADGATVGTWKDKSGTANNATATTGATLQTDSVGRYLDFQGSSSYNLTASSWAYNQYYTIFIVDKPLAYDTDYSLVGHTVASTDSFYIQYNTTDGIRLSSQGDNAALGTAFESLTAPVNIWCFTNYGGKTAYWNKLISGKTPVAAAYITDSLLTIGSKEAGSDPYSGRMREILMYSGVMTEDNRELITTYLYNKWFTQPVLIPLTPVENSAILWLDAADVTTFFQDLSGTIPTAGNGSIVKLWKDKSGFGNNIYASASPTYSTTAINSLPAFFSNSAGGTIETGNYLQTGDATLFIVAEATAAASSYYFLHDTLNSFGLSADSGISSWHESATINNNQFVDNGNTFLFYGKMKKSQLLSGTYIDLSGIQYSYTVDTLNMSVATAPIKLNSVDAVYYGEVIYYNRVLTDAEIQQNVEYLSNKWQIPVPVTAPPFLPTGLTGLQLWLDSSDVYTLFQSGGIVTIWKDRSGNGYNAVPHGSPTVNNGVVFDGSGQYLSLPDGALPTGDYSYYAVTKFAGDSVIVSGGSMDISGQMWVAVGYNTGYTTSIAISYDGLIWINSTNNPFSGGPGAGIAWNGSYWVAVGANTDNTVCIAKSTDGLTWTNSTNNPFSGNYGNGIAWNGSYWVSVGRNSGQTVAIAKSTDGMTWTDASNNPFSGELGYGIAWNGSYWVAVGTNTGGTVCIAKSTDGMTWTNSTDNPFSGGTGQGIAWNASYWVAVGANTGATVCIAKSTDGMTWTNSTNNPFSGGSGQGQGIAWNGSYWVAVGYNTGNTVAIAKSTDGLTWTNATDNPFSGGSGYGLEISWNGTYWVAVGSNSGGTVAIAKSTDGLIWLATTNNPFSGGSGQGNGIATGNAPIHNSIATIQTVTVDAERVGQTVFDYNTLQTLTDTNVIPGTTTVIVESLYSTTDNGKSLFLSGLTGETDTSVHFQDASNNFIGKDLSGGYMNGTIKEILAYNTKHTTAQRQQVEAYLKGKWYPNPYTPTGTSLWLDAGSASYFTLAGTNVQSWNDRSGNGNNFSQSAAWAQPIYSLDSVTGRYGVQFAANGIANGLASATSPFGSTSSCSIFAVERYDYSTDQVSELVNGNVCTTYEIDVSSNLVAGWVATGTGVNNIAHSTNGLDWTGGNNLFSGGIVSGIAWNSSDSYWVAVGANTGGIAKSYNGTYWTNSTSNPFSGGNCFGIAWNGSYWVAVGHNTDATVSIAKSTDGLTWTNSTDNPFDAFGLGIAWNGSYWVAVGYNTSSTVCIAKSTDGLIWTNSTNNPFSGGQSIGIAWNGSTWVAVGFNTGYTVCIATSTDGLTWTNSTDNPFSGTSGKGIAWNGSYWVAVGANTGSTVCIAKSTDGLLWTNATDNPFSGGTGTGLGISWNGSYWVAVGYNGPGTVAIAKSTDGLLWTNSTNNPFAGNYSNAIAYGSINQSPILKVGTTSVATPSVTELNMGVNGFSTPATAEIHTKPVLTSQVINTLAYNDFYNGTTNISLTVRALTASTKLNIGFTGTLTPALAGAMRGYIYELIVFNTSVNTPTRQAIEGYLAWKWGIQSSLSITHPYYLAPP